MDESGRRELTTHIEEHVSYPISKKEFLASCGNLSHVPAGTRDWVALAMPERTFESAEDIYHALNLPHGH